MKLNLSANMNIKEGVTALEQANVPASSGSRLLRSRLRLHEENKFPAEIVRQSMKSAQFLQSQTTKRAALIKTFRYKNVTYCFCACGKKTES